MALNKLLTRHARFATAISRYFRNNPPHHDRVAVVLVVGCVQITVATTPSAFGQTELLYSPRCMARFRIINAIRLEYEIVRMSERTRVNNEPLVVVALWPSVVYAFASARNEGATYIARVMVDAVLAQTMNHGDHHLARIPI